MKAKGFQLRFIGLKVAYVLGYVALKTWFASDIQTQT